MRLLALLLLLVPATPFAQTINRPFGGGRAGFSYYMPTADLANTDARFRSLTLLGPNDNVSGFGWLLLPPGGRICFNTGPATGWPRPQCVTRLYNNGPVLQTDSPFHALTINTYWVTLPPQDPSGIPCGSANVGTLITYQPSGARTRQCMCTSDGAGTPAYAWQNVVTGAVGTSTTCAL